MSKLFVVMFLLVVVLFSPAFSQDEATEQAVTFKGFVKFDAMFDSRQTVAAREGHFLLYPTAVSEDANGDDVNAVPNFNQLAVQTRLTVGLKGPDAFGAKTSGVVEGAFFGHSDGDINGFRLRHAYAQLTWEESNLIFGQYWHPMFVTGCFPGVVSFNTGVPFQPFSRNPQMRFTKSFGDATVIAALLSQRDFASPGGSASLRNALIPNVHVQLQMKSGDHLFGAGMDYKMLRPKLTTVTGLKAAENVTGISFLGFAKMQLGDATIKVEGVYGQNLYDHLMLGGYAVSDTNATTLEESYTPYNVMSVWSDISFGKEFAPGLFIGYTKNSGTADDIIQTAPGSSITTKVYARGSNIDNVMRVSPRLVWNSGKTSLACELEYTAAAYGTADNTDKGKVTNTESASNIRFLFAVLYFFGK